MPLVDTTYQVTATIIVLATLFSIPLSIYLPNGQRLIDALVYKYITWRSGEPAAKRNIFHPLHRYDLAVLNSDGTLLAPHGAKTKQTGTPLLSWSNDGYWALVLTGARKSLATAQWNDLKGIDRLVERLAVEPSVSPSVQAATPLPDPAALAPTHTLARTLKDLQEATGAPQKPLGGVAQLVRHEPSQKAVAVLLTLPANLADRKDFIVQAMATKGWNQVPLSHKPTSICLTLATHSVWRALSPAISNPEGEPNGHRRW